MRRGGFSVACALAFLIPAAAGARTVLSMPTEADANIKVQVESCFSQLPACGYMPVDVTINNSSGRARTWKLHFASPAGSYVRYSSAAEPEEINRNASVSVESGAARTFKLLVPISTADQASTLSVELSGYGVPSGALQFFPIGSRSGKVLTPCMAVSDGASAELGKHLEEAANAESHQLYEVNFRADELPDDWRALSGFAGIWLLDSEWKALAPAQRTAIEDWVAMGGKVLLCAKAAPGPTQWKGLGSIVNIDLRSLDRSATRAEWGGMLRGDVAKVVNEDRTTHWKSADGVGVLKPNLPLLISFLVIFATVVGPVNLFVFGKEGKRSRLYWTVPAISLGATAVLALLIIVEDGFGGRGIRSALICLVPSARKAVVIQEQISRTGVVGSAAFSLRDPAWMTMVNSGSRAGAGRNAPTVQNADLHFDQDWFKSRSVQAHWMESIIPTRAEVALVNPEEARGGHTPPVIISSIAVPLRDFCFWDAQGKCWRATNVRTGVKTALSPGKALDDPLSGARAALRRRLTAAENNKGGFVGVSGDAASFIETLSSIRWKNGPAVYVGQVTGAEVPK